MDRARHIPLAVIRQKIHLQQLRQFRHLFAFHPSDTGAFNKLGLEILVALGFVPQLLTQPLNGRCLVHHVQGELFDTVGGQRFFVIFGNLPGQKKHAIPLRESLSQPQQKFRRGERLHYPLRNVSIASIHADRIPHIWQSMH